MTMGDASDECFCGFLSLRKGTRLILYISAIRQLFHLLQFFSASNTTDVDESRGATYAFLFFVFFTAAVLIIGLGIRGEQTEDSTYIKYFYYFLHCEAILILIEIIFVTLEGKEKAVLVITHLIFLGVQGYFIWVVKRYREILEKNVQQGSYQLPDEPPPFPV